MLLKIRIFTIGIFNALLSVFGYALAKKTELQRLRLLQNGKAEKLLDFVTRFPGNHAAKILELERFSKSQLKQDLFVIAKSNFKNNGYFVEFGATNGIDLSNTWLLANHFSWTGILCEPAKIWQDELLTNRSESIINFDCVWKNSSSEIKFKEAHTPELSTIKGFSNFDSHGHERVEGTEYTVSTISLQDLLESNGAPSFIDYLSIDTEGSEYEILSAFDFSKFSFGVITCEHNYSGNRTKIYDLLTANGYTRVWETASDFDDWYLGPRMSAGEIRNV